MICKAKRHRARECFALLLSRAGRGVMTDCPISHALLFLAGWDEGWEHAS